MTQKAIEVKSGQTIDPSFFKGIKYFSKLSGQVQQSFLIYGGDESREQEQIDVIGWKTLDTIDV